MIDSSEKSGIVPLPLRPVPYEQLVIWVLELIEQPLPFLPIDDFGHLICEVEVIEFAGDERECGVDGVVLGGDVVDGCVADEDGED